MNKYFAVDTESGRKRFRVGDLFFECNLELSIEIDREIASHCNDYTENSIKTKKTLMYYGRDVLVGSASDRSPICDLFVYTVREIQDNPHSDHLIEPLFVFARNICIPSQTVRMLHAVEHIIHLRQMECL